MWLFLDVDYYAEAWWDWPASPEGGGGTVVSCSGAEITQESSTLCRHTRHPRQSRKFIPDFNQCSDCREDLKKCTWKKSFELFKIRKLGSVSDWLCCRTGDSSNTIHKDSITIISCLAPKKVSKKFSVTQFKPINFPKSNWLTVDWVLTNMRSSRAETSDLHADRGGLLWWSGPRQLLDMIGSPKAAGYDQVPNSC